MNLDAVFLLENTRCKETAYYCVVIGGRMSMRLIC